MSAPAPATPGFDDGSSREWSEAEVRALAEREAREMLGVSLDEAFVQLDRGDLKGTIAEAEFSMLRSMLEG